ncbi:hypothetical protein MAM1_0002c00197 [Mucor ambiguus]|uniref:Uncharacterized protein n=1 Tax=Mucor ambiguus TaxID=91626 RepID=A0A0C9M3U1_9FUNG|nr:hypothetical protein MAM1_0002c00197 [Mucor ambiguus]
MNMAAMTQQEADIHSHNVLYMIPSTKYQFEKDGEKTLLQDHIEDGMPANINQTNRNMFSSRSPTLTGTPRKHVPVQLYDNPSPALSMIDIPSSTRSISRHKKPTNRSRSLSTKKTPVHKYFFHKMKSFFTYSSKN